MVHFDQYKEQMEVLSETSHPNTNENKVASVTPAVKTAQHPQPWCGQHLATDNANTKNIYSYTSIESKEKSSMWRIAELARYNKLKHEYTLLDESGPAHKKLFTVRLVLTEDQCFEGSGASIKKAQQAAASVAISKTTLNFPPEKAFKRKKEASPPELLAFFTRRLDLPDPVYKPHAQPKPPRTRVQAPFPNKGVKPFFPGPYSNIPPVYGARGMVSCHNGPHPNQPMMCPSTCVHPGMIPPINVPCVSVYPLETHDRVCLVTVYIGTGKAFTGVGQTFSQAKYNAAAQALCYLGPAITKLEAKFKGEQTSKAVTVDEVSNSSKLDCDDLEFSTANGMLNNTGGSSQSSDDHPKPKQKSVVSTVHECAHQMKLDVEIEVLKEDGPPHERSYVVRCALRDVSEQVIVEHLGEGRKKKIATQQACLGVLERLRELENSPIYMASFLFKAQKKGKACSKEGKRKTIVKDMKMDPSYGHQINPVTRLSQILNARNEPDPVFTVVGEHGLSRYKEFIVEVRCGEIYCMGTGPNKRLAKRAAAEELLSRLGFIKPLPAPGKSLLKKKESLNAIGMFDPNDLCPSEKAEHDDPNTIVEDNTQNQSTETKTTTTENTPTPSEPSSGHVSPSLAPGSPNIKRRVTFSNQVRACPPPEDANYPQPEVAPLKVDVVVEGRLKRMRKSKDGKRSLSDTEKSELMNSAIDFVAEHCGSPKEDGQVFRVKLDFFADKYKFSVQYTNFPKSPDGCEQYYFALVTLGLDKPVVCHGSGLTDEGAAENGAFNAICKLTRLVEDESSTTTGNS